MQGLAPSKVVRSAKVRRGIGCVLQSFAGGADIDVYVGNPWRRTRTNQWMRHPTKRAKREVDRPTRAVYAPD